MKILFLLFSGTNNTQEIARLLASDFSLQGHSFEIMKIDIETPLIDLDQYDLIGLGYPIYAFNEPRFFWRYVKKLKMNKRAKYFIFKTSGETLGLNNASSRRLIRHLKRQKCVLLGDYHFVMPYNIHFRFEDAFVKEIMAYNRKLSKVLVSNVLNEEKHFLKSNFVYSFVAWIIGIQRPGATINSYFYKADMQKCTKCLRCVRDCPTKNIAYQDGKIKFQHHCQMCMRCSFFCPTDAINIGFLNGWKVNGAYRFKAIDGNNDLKLPYIDQNAKGFYRCFISYFSEVDRLHQKYLTISGDRPQ